MIKKFSINPNPDMSKAYASSSPDFGRIQRAASLLPEGATVSESVGSKTANLATMSNMGMGSAMQQQYGNGLFHVNRFYDPEVESPDRQYYPRDRIQANKYWRLFYEQDPLIGNAVDMYATMMISDFDIIIQNDSNTQIKYILSDMLEDIQFVQKFKDLIVEYLIIGEAFPHLFFDNTSGLWTYMTLHNPDNMEVVDAPVVNMEPIINFLPDQATIQLLNDSSSEAREIRESLPPEFLSKVRAGQKIRMKNVNCSYLARKLHPYDERGTSIISRLWRILICEDSVYAATLAMFRRAASPLKVLKMGNQCFVAGVPVITSEGVKNVEDVKIGDMVISGDGNWKEVINAWEEPPSETVKIKALGTEVIECTPNHKFKVWARPRVCACGCGRPLNKGNGKTASYIFGHNRSAGETSRRQWITYCQRPLVRCFEDHDPIKTLEASAMQAGDYLLIPRKFERSNIEITDKTKAMARLLGYYVAEGSRCIHYKRENRKSTGEELDWSGINIAFSLEEMSTNVKDVLEICELLGVEARFRVRLLKDGVRTGVCLIDIDRIESAWLSMWCIENGGLHSHSKSLSQFVMGWPVELKEELLKGMFRGDGHRSKSVKFVEYDSTSKSLVYQVRLIAAQLGHLGHISFKTYAQENWNDCYRVSFYGEDSTDVRRLIWDEDGPRPDVTSAIRYWSDSDYLYVPIIGIERGDKPVPVYNLTVEGDHSYTACGVQTFNSSGWIPDPSEWQNLLSLLVSAEQDPQTWIATHYGVNFEAWGANERSVTISKEHDTIEKIKLIGLGLSKSFISGEGTFATAKSGLQVFLRRLLSLRQYFEATWIYPKLINPICEINGWSKSSPSEVAHNFRVKRGQEEQTEAGLSIRPRIRWKNKLDPMVDSDMLQAYQQLRNLGFPVSKDTIGTSVYLNWENEQEKDAKEFKEKHEILERTVGTKWKNLYEQSQLQGKAAPGAKPGGAPGSGAMPPGAQGKPAPKPMDDASKPPGSGADSMPNGPSSDGIEAPSGGGVPEGV